MIKKPHDGAEAHTLKLAAKRLRKTVEVMPDYNPTIDRMDLAQADEMEAVADAFLKLPRVPEPAALGGEIGLQVRYSPDFVTMAASSERIQLASECQAFNLGLDAAETIGAKDATEQMLAHQMAAAHRMAMMMMTKSMQQRDTVEMARLANTAARLMDTYQKGMLTFNRIRTGGKQVVTVQHVQVQGGGQAVINGSVQTGGLLPEGGGSKN